MFVDEDSIERGRALDFEISISLELQGALQAPVDVKVINYAPLAFQYYCTTGTLLMCRNDDIRVDFLTKMRSLYFDFKPWSQRFLREMLSAE